MNDQKESNRFFKKQKKKNYMKYELYVRDI